MGRSQLLPACPYFLYEAVHRLIAGAQAQATTLAIALTASSVALMPLLGWAKLRLGRRLHSGATAGEGVQNLLCAVQALAAVIALIGAGAGIALLDPIAALTIAAIAAKEGAELWHGDRCDCHTALGLDLDRDSDESYGDDCRANDYQDHAESRTTTTTAATATAFSQDTDAP